MREKRFMIEGAVTQDVLCDQGAECVRQADTLEEAIEIAKEMIKPEFGQNLGCAQVVNKNGWVVHQELK